MLRHFFPISALFGLAGAVGFAQSPTPPAGMVPAPTTLSRIYGLFDIDLPELDPPGTVKLIIRPHVSDLIRRNYLRTEVGFRWAVNDHFEFNSEAATFLTHGLANGSPGYGVGELHFGAKYILPAWPWPNFESSVSLKLQRPIGHPPLDLTDGHNHVTPGLIIQHHSNRYPRLTTFTGASIDVVTPSSVRGHFEPNQPRDDSLSVTAGGVYEMGQIKWTLSGTYTTTAPFADRPDHFFYLQPSLLWYVPKKLAFHSKTQWIIGFGTPMIWGPAGYEFKVATRLRAEITFRQVLENIRHVRSP